MTTPSTGIPQWEMVDEGWGRKAVDFATLSEPGNCREYVAMHHDVPFAMEFADPEVYARARWLPPAGL
jgi:hypothetical protein